MIEGQFIPVNEDEEELMHAIFVLTRQAHNEGVPKIRIAQILGWFLTTALDPKSMSSEELEEWSEGLDLDFNESPENEEQPACCPRCGDDVSDVMTQMGGQIYIEPCGHIIEWEERETLGGYVKSFEQEVTSLEE